MPLSAWRNTRQFRKRHLSRRDFLKEITWAGAGLAGLSRLGALRLMGSTALGRGSADHNDLYEGFKNPGKDYDLFPLWTWNGRIEVKEAQRQIDEMLGQGIRRAIVYPFPNLRIRFLSEEWWNIWGELLAYARTKGFQLGVNAENEWPDGDAFDQWLDPPDQSHVLLGHPEYHMKRLAYVEREFAGPGAVSFHNLPNPVVAVAARLTGADHIDGESLMDLSTGISNSSFSAELASGDWRLMFFYLENAIGSADQMRVDPLNRGAVARFIDLTLGEYHRRFKEYFGNTFTFVLVDNEGDYGNQITWTPALFETFQSEKGYDLRKYLPLLIYAGGRKTPKVRIDYLRVISDLYERNYWGQMAEWCKERGVIMTAQGWSESLQYDAAYGGDYMQMERSFGIPGVEALGYKGRSPREFIEDESIADFEGKRYWCEGPLVLGSTSYVSPQMERYTSNMLALWGINLWSPQFYYDVPAMNFPPDVFISQPWWKYFRYYNDYVRRISFMNEGGKHVVDLLLYRPTDTTFAYADPAFQKDDLPNIVPESTATPPSTTSRIDDSGSKGGWGIDYPRMLWNSNFAATVETAYFDLMESLTGYQRSYNVADDHYLQLMELDNGRLRIADMSFRGIILPPMKVINRASLAKIREFYEQGGLVIAVDDLPEGSSEEGWDDPAVAADIAAIFGVKPGSKEASENSNSQGGKAFFVVGNIKKVLQKIDDQCEPDLKVEEGSRERLLYFHKVKDGHDLYWVVNDTDRPREVLVSMPVTGKVQLWDPASGERRDTPHWMKEGRTHVRLNLGVWDATYVVFDQTEELHSEISVHNTNLETLSVRASQKGLVVEGLAAAGLQQLFIEGQKGGKDFRVEEDHRALEPQVLSSGNWNFKLAMPTVDVGYVRETVVRAGAGIAEGFAEPNYSDSTWPLVRLSSNRSTLRDWWVLGPFPDPNHGEGYTRIYPPEQKIDLDARYDGAYSAEIGWRHYHSTDRVVNLTQALALDPKGGAVAYAMTFVYATREQQVDALLVTPNAKLWVNGELVFGRYNRPNYYEMRDPFGYTRSVLLKKGWNQVLLKLAGDPRHPQLLFYLHFLDKQGAPVQNLVTFWQPDEAEALKKLEEEKLMNSSSERWYRLEVPPGTRSFLLPKRDLIESAYLNGREVKPVAGRIEYPNLSFGSCAVLTLKIPGGAKLTTPLSFESGETTYHLGCWTGTGLTYYAGSASYEKVFELAPDLEKQQVVLDCGSVGVVAEVWLNEQKVGERIWEPFSINVTRFLRPGANRLKIVVTNTSDALRTNPDRMQVIDMNGLLGPVRLIPYRKTQFTIPL